MDSRAFSLGAAVLTALAPIAGLWLVSTSSVDGAHVAAALVAIVLGSFITPAVSSGNRLTLSISVAAALPFILTHHGEVDLPGVVGVYMLGSVMLVVLEVLRFSDFWRAFTQAARHLLGYTTFALVYALVSSTTSGWASGWQVLIPFGAGGLAWLGMEISIWALFAAPTFRVSPRYLALSEVKDANVFVSLVATGALFGLMFEQLDWWALPVALLPYSFAHGAFKRFQETRSTYRQTIRALAQIPEAAGLNLRGHSDRTAELAVAMAKDLGLSPEEVEDVEFAALMHDIGHITLNDPMVVEQGWSEEDLARWGAEIIAGAPSLDRVAGYVRRQYEPFRNPGERSDPTVPTVARIIKIASAYDAERVGNGASRLEALEHLHQGAAYDYDPEVVDSLRRVLDSDQSVTV